jgi:hypothetical protein
MTLRSCPLCSHFAHEPEPIIRGPSMMRSRHNGRYGIVPCCSLSSGGPWAETEQPVADWWHARREATLDCIATNNRRMDTLAKLKALEAKLAL